MKVLDKDLHPSDKLYNLLIWVRMEGYYELMISPILVSMPYRLEKTVTDATGDLLYNVHANAMWQCVCVYVNKT